MGKAAVAQPHPMPMAPGLAYEPEIVAQQEGLNADPGAANVLGCRVTGTNQVTDRLMQKVGHPDVGEFAGAEKPCERDGVPTVILDPLSGPSWRHGWGTDAANKAKPR